MKKKQSDELYSSNPLSIYLKKLAKKNKKTSLMEAQNLEANKLGFKNWHFLLKHIKNKFSQSFQDHPFNPKNKNNRLNPILQPYVFNLGFNLDYGIDFYANKSQLRNRFTSLHSKNFNQKYILHSIEELKKLNNYSVLFCQNKIGDIHYDFDVYIDENHSSHYLKIPFTNTAISHLFHKLSDTQKNYINILFFKHQYKNEYIDLDDLIDFFSHITNIYLNINDDTFNNFIKNTLNILIELKNLSFFDKSKPEFILNSITFSNSNIISLTPISYFNIFELFLQHIVIDQLAVPLDSQIKKTTQYNIALITYNINIFSSYFVIISQLRAIACLSLSFFDLDSFIDNKHSIEIIIANTTHFILPSYDLTFTNNFLEFMNYDISDLSHYPNEWILNPTNFIITSQSNNYTNHNIKNINLCSINNK